MLIDLIYHAVAQPAFVIHGVRKIVSGLTWEEKTMPPALDILKELGYQKGKVTRLMNLYYNAEEVRKAKAQLARRKGNDHSSVSIMMRNQEKRTHGSQGHCIQNIVISEKWLNEKTRINSADIFYRSTEAIQKFGADLSLIQRVFDELGINPTPVRFYFANLYVSAVCFPLLFHHTDPVKFMEHIRKHDKVFFPIALRGMSRYMNPNVNYNYGAVRRMRKHRDTLERGPIDAYLLKYFPDYHRDHMPKRKSK